MQGPLCKQCSGSRLNRGILIWISGVILLPTWYTHYTKQHGTSSTKAFHSKRTLSLKKQKQKTYSNLKENYKNWERIVTCRNTVKITVKKYSRKYSILPKIKVGQLAILAFKPWWNISWRNMIVSLKNKYLRKQKRQFRSICQFIIHKDAFLLVYWYIFHFSRKSRRNYCYYGSKQFILLHCLDFLV